MFIHRGGQRDSFPHILLSFLIKSNKYIFVSFSRLVFLLKSGITFRYIKPISQSLNHNNHQHKKNNQTEGVLEVCYQWKRAPVPSQKRAKWCKNYVKTITVIRIIHKPINYPKCTKKPMNWAG